MVHVVWKLNASQLGSCDQDTLSTMFIHHFAAKIVQQHHEKNTYYDMSWANINRNCKNRY